MSKEEENQIGLVYDGAITENEIGKVNIHSVNYMLNGLKISANVYTPANFDETNQYPTVVVAHPNGGVKEQVAGLYSQKLAELGYITMAFDAAYQGKSEGEPRNTDKPQNRVEDIHRAIDYIVNYKGVDRTRVGILGICGGGGYTLRASQTDKRIKAVATLSAFNTGIVRKNGFLDSQLQKKLKKCLLIYTKMDMSIMELHINIQDQVLLIQYLQILIYSVLMQE